MCDEIQRNVRLKARTPRARASSTVRSVEAESTYTTSAPPARAAAASAERRQSVIYASSFLPMTITVNDLIVLTITYLFTFTSLPTPQQLSRQAPHRPLCALLR